MYDSVLTHLTHRPKQSHKYNFGHVLVLGGSSGMVGAPFLAAQAALRVGAGLVTIASDQPVIEKLERRVVEIMTLTVATDSAQSLSTLEDYIATRKVSMLVIGPGLRPTAAPLVLSLLSTTALPTLLDGGALSIVATDRNALHNHASDTLILTPHAGELQRFFKEPLPKSQSSIVNQAKYFAKTEQLILVMKGHPTYTITPQGSVIKNESGGPALATAGTGDVLAGMIGGIVAQGIDAEQAVPAAVYLHGKAGDIAAQLKTEAGVIASDVIELIPNALKEM